MRSLKISLLCAFIALITSTVSAQKFGIRAGANISNISGKGLDTTAKTGLYAGVYKEIPLVKSLLFIQPEIQYSQEGYSTDVKDVKINYLTVPVLAKVYLVKMFSFETGPQFGFAVNDNVDYTDVKSFVPSWAFGMSFNLPVGLSLNTRYVSALDDTFDGVSGKNQVIQLGASFQF